MIELQKATDHKPHQTTSSLQSGCLYINVKILIYRTFEQQFMQTTNFPVNKEITLIC